MLAAAHRESQKLLRECQVSTILRVLGVIDLFTETKPIWTADELIEAQATSRATTYRDLRALVDAGFLAPVKADGSGVYKRGSVLPVRFQMVDANGNPVEGPGATFSAVKISGTDAGTVASAKGTGGAFKYRPKKKRYAYRLKTASLTPGVWQLQVQLDDGRKYTVDVTIR